ncbi:ABC transporter ATP-binding protein [Desulfococcaceae bacterium HSG8]|nr:ABC transporter ATP-binding protein [Desulfococcaceae bacterium HSG8]
MTKHQTPNTEHQTPDTLLEIENLKVHIFTKKGIVKAVDGITFDISRSETLGLIGESGCGKTTAALSIINLVRPPGRITGGKIIFDGQDLVPMSNYEMRRLRGKEISIVRQEAQNALNPVMNIGKQITEMIIEHENVTKAAAWERARSQLNLVGISDARIRSYPHEFSGGMKQRVMISIATSCNPRFLILDEPTTGLDVIVQRQMLSLINNLKIKLSLTAILISHDLSVIAETCDKVAVMYGGKIMEQADTLSLYKNPMHPYSQALIGAYPSLKEGKKALKSIPGAPPRPISPPPGCRFEPRCAYAMRICREEEPLTVRKEGHLVACHLISD